MVSFSVNEVLDWVNGKLVNSAELGSKAEQIRVQRPVPLLRAQSNDLAFFFSKSFQHELPYANPGILVTGSAFVEPLRAAGLPIWKTAAIIACDDPYFSMALISERFAAVLSTVAHVKTSGARRANEIHPTAIVASSAELGEGVQVGPHCVIEDGVRIGSGTVLYPGCYIGPQCTVGQDCVFFPGVTLYEWTQIGSRVRVHARSVLGADGFGYAPLRKDGKVSGHQKIYHLGRVIVGDDVEIGANSAIDRATFGETRIENHAKVDNLVQVGHNCTLNEGAVICGSAGLAGSVNIGKYAYVAGLAGVADHVHVGDGAIVGAMSLISKDVEPNSLVIGNPQRNHKEHFRLHAMLNKLLADRKKGAKS